MKSPFSGVALLVVAIVALIVVFGALFTVVPTEQALVLRFGQPVRDPIDAPGLYVKWPFVDSVIYIDKRILDLDETRQEVLVSDNQRLEVDAFVRYRISDPLAVLPIGRLDPGGERPARRHAQFGPAPDPRAKRRSPISCATSATR